MTEMEFDKSKAGTWNPFGIIGRASSEEDITLVKDMLIVMSGTDALLEREKELGLEQITRKSVSIRHRFIDVALGKLASEDRETPTFSDFFRHLKKISSLEGRPLTKFETMVLNDLIECFAWFLPKRIPEAERR